MISGRINVAVAATSSHMKFTDMIVGIDLIDVGQIKSNDQPEGRMTREIRKQTAFIITSHPSSFSVNIILLNIPRHPKICYLTLLSFTNENISSCQVTVDYLKEKLYLGCSEINELFKYYITDTRMPE